MLKIVNYYNYTHVTPLRKVRRGKGVTISPTVWFAEPERIRLGDGVHLNGGCMLWAGPTRGTITVGDHALFGPNVMITAAHYRFQDGQPVTEQEMNECNVIIGRDVWLATGVTVVAGAEIGDGCIVAANSVVRGKFPPFSILSGVPAQIVGHRNPQGAPTAAELERLGVQLELLTASDRRTTR